MMVIRIEAVYATFSDAQTLAKYILDIMNAKTSSSSMGWISRTRKYTSTFKSFLDTTQYDLAGRPIPPSQQLGEPRVTSSTATFRPIGGMINNQPIQSERDEDCHSIRGVCILVPLGVEPCSSLVVELHDPAGNAYV
jgi:hypothetical protein